MEDALDAKIGELSDWIIEQALIADIEGYNVIFTEFCERLSNCGVPLLRCHAAMQTLHPMINAVSITWYRGGETTLREHLFEGGGEDSDDWLRNPLKALIDSSETFVHHPLPPDDELAARHPLLAELAEKGATGYLGFTVQFMPGDISLNRQGGMIASFTTDAAGGFTDSHIDAIKRILPRFALVAKLSGRERLFHNVLAAYFGPDSGRRVREGQISLGSGQMIDAVIWFSDLRNSTPLAEQLGHEKFLALLNDYFAALSGAVMDSGGEVLRFIGDAALAIFPISEDAFTETEARQRAVSAARDAVIRAKTINAVRVDRGDEPFDYGIGLHVGEIMYGNIGVPTRVEFSVIGAAANEAARIESLCKTLGEPVLVSQVFTDGLDEEWRDLGDQAIRGSQRPIRLFGLSS